MKSCRLREFVFDTWESLPSYKPSQFQSSMPVHNRKVLGDNERLPKREVTSVRQHGQLGGWHCEMMSHVTGMRTEFGHAAGDEVTPKIIQYSLTSKICV
jgi:hypothetical protein